MTSSAFDMGDEEVHIEDEGARKLKNRALTNTNKTIDRFFISQKLSDFRWRDFLCEFDADADGDRMENERH